MKIIVENEVIYDSTKAGGIGAVFVYGTDVYVWVYVDPENCNEDLRDCNACDFRDYKEKIRNCRVCGSLEMGYYGHIGKFNTIKLEEGEE